MAILPMTRDTVVDARGRVATILAGFTTGQKVLTGLAAVGLVMAGVFFTSLESSPSYQPLFTNLQASDAGAITAQLTSDHVPYQLSDNGSTISVPAADVDQERVALAQQGLPASGNVGFSNLEKGGITTSDFVQQVEYQQALEGQLAQTIESISGVQSAQVNLVVPQQSDFAVGSTTPTTASILVDLTPGTVLTSGQVDAIVHLAASATPDLSAQNVTVVDNQGDVLNAPGVSGDGSSSSDSQETDNYDNQLAAAITAMIARVVGQNNAAVQVHAQLNFNQTTTNSSTFPLDKNGQPITAPTSTSNTTTNSTGGSSAAQGVLGATATTGTTTGTGNSTSTSSQISNAVGQVNQTVTDAPGQVEQTSVAVLLNKTATKKVPLSEVKSLVTAAAGLNLSKGDQLVVTALPFAAAPAVAAGAGAASSQLVPTAEKVLGLLLLIFGLYFLALRSSKKRKPLYQEIPIGELPSMVPVDDDPTGEIPAVGATTLQLGPDAVLAQVNDFIDQQPSEAAQLLRMWADERQGSDQPVRALQA